MKQQTIVDQTTTSAEAEDLFEIAIMHNDEDETYSSSLTITNKNDDEYKHLLTNKSRNGLLKGNAQNHPPVMRRFSLFVDGMARAMILPFGPSLVYRLVYNDGMYNYGSLPLLNEAGVALYFAMVVSVYIFGRWFGMNILTTLILNYIAVNHKRTDGIPIYVARLGGFSLALHFFTYGAGLTNIQWLILIRFFSAVLAGVMCGITQQISLPEDDWVYRSSKKAEVLLSNQEEIIEALRRREGYIDIASGTAKIYLTGFAVSILSGGLLFRKVTKDATFRALTGAEKYTLSPIFLIVIAVTSEFALRKIFLWASSQQQAAISDEKDVLMKKVVVDVEVMKRDSVGANPSVRKRTFSTSKPPFQPVIEEDQTIDDKDTVLNVATLSTPARVRLDSSSSFTWHGRTRGQSETSIDEFFDCQSFLSDVEDGFGVYPSKETETIDKTFEIASYRKGKIIYADGSPAYVPHGDCIGIVPTNYIEFYNGIEAKAVRAWETTQSWRKSHHVWKINSTHNKWFHKIKDSYPHFVHGRSKSGYPVIYEQPGKMNLKHLFQNGCDVTDMVLHYTFFMEFVSNTICKKAEFRTNDDSSYNGSSSWGTMVVMDVTGASLSHLSGDVLKYLKQAGDINSAHYPNNMKRAFLVNSPFWLAGAWSGIKSILPESVQVEILSKKNTLGKLNEYIDLDQIPQEYGGTSPYKLGEHPYELELKDLVESVNDGEENDDCEIDSEEYSTMPKSHPSATHELTVEKNIDTHTIPNLVKTTPTMNSLRLRFPSVDHDNRLSDRMITPENRRDKHVLVIVSGIHICFSFVQGAMELGIPLWMLYPRAVGGLGYSPSKIGVSLFCAAIVLLWTLRKKSSRLVSRIPGKEPLRGFRIGSGSESALFTLLGLMSLPNQRTEENSSVFLMASTIILFASLALASMLGRTSSKILHRIASESFSKYANQGNNASTGRSSYKAHRILTGCESGQFTTLLNLLAEITGIFAFVPLWYISISGGSQSPINCTCVLFISALITFMLYASSFVLNLNAAGEFVTHQHGSCQDSLFRKSLIFVRDVLAISAGDMASLLEEANWTSSSLFAGAGRSRTFSDMSAIYVAEQTDKGDAAKVLWKGS